MKNITIIGAGTMGNGNCFPQHWKRASFCGERNSDDGSSAHEANSCTRWQTRTTEMALMMQIRVLFN